MPLDFGDGFEFEMGRGCAQGIFGACGCLVMLVIAVVVIAVIASQF